VNTLMPQLIDRSIHNRFASAGTNRSPSSESQRKKRRKMPWVTAITGSESGTASSSALKRLTLETT
jgi:hypothetical protein